MLVALLDQPSEYYDLLGKDISNQLLALSKIPDLVHFFAADYERFLFNMKLVEPIIKKNPRLIIWVSWYKKSSGLGKGMSEDLIRAFALEKDLVDIKVCAVSPVWSGLKLVVRKNKR